MKFLLIGIVLVLIGQTYAGLTVGKCAISPVLPDFDINKVFNLQFQILNFKF